MKKIAIAGISILFTVLTFWACQKEFGKNESISGTESTEAVTSRTDCPYLLQITGANGMFLCGVTPATPNGQHCSVCQDVTGAYDQLLLNSSPATINFPKNTFSIWNPIGADMHPRRVTFQVVGNACPDTFNLATGVIYSFQIYKDPESGCCRVKLYCN
ncbi:MAG: hypothetical protein WCR52_13940 [Bacteroidota bacterium]